MTWLPVKHHPTLTSSRYGCRAYCACGWASERAYTTVTGAHYAFGQHLAGATS